ncbi:chemotaxis protein CheA [Rhodobacter sp. Har01]|uniref:chemotaxis protein CheA n=1 Tax=Rhodobacter sp. Har01 TaxID=2883999 RepID=UPI001D07FCC0|nr:chemotaxis protein CheA [Rhodobacter sp. Har01]MCB6176782.1 chemotaxis protein CheA [Rhodobacter sp. Har01]
MATMNSIRDTFYEECEELLEALAEGLSSMDAGAQDSETLNAVFRAVHSIKGGAGAFALNALVAFAHRFETVLDGIRSDRIELTPEVMHTLLRSADHLADQVEAAREERVIDPETTDGFLANLNAVLGEDAPASPGPGDDDPCFGFAAVTLDFGDLGDDAAPIDLPDLTGLPDLAAPSPATDAAAATTGYLIRFRPLPALYANGHDPALLFSALADLGTLEVRLDTSALPDWAAFDPADAYLSWTIRLATAEPETLLHEAFEFVEGLCVLDIGPEAAEPAEPHLPAAAAGEAVPASAGPLPAEVPVAAPPTPAAEALAEPVPSPAPAAAPRAKREARPADEDGGNGGPKPTLRVDLDRVDRLINAVGELIINQAMIEQSVLDLSLNSDAEIITHVEDYRLLARDLQEAVMAIRAQPVKPLFQRMSRIVREAAEATGKAARLVTSGEGTEVDKTVIERLADPLTHMIRNAVDHGLEPQAARIAAGKDPEGTIRLLAAHRSGSVIITVRDDGAGLNRAKIRDKAVAKGLITAEADLTDSEVDNLLFLPGFSTADKVSNLSGRGVGLDVVKNAVAALGGRVSIASVPGEGTEFTISLPLTLAVMDGMVISVAGQTMVIPVASVIETIRPGPGDLHVLGTQEKVLSIRGRFLPMIDVAQCLGLPARATGEAPLLLLVETENQSQCALVVDAVLDQRQVVIKGLESNYGAIPGVSAATVLGDGQIALILDAEALTSNRGLGDMPLSRPVPHPAGASHASL